MYNLDYIKVPNDLSKCFAWSLKCTVVTAFKMVLHNGTCRSEDQYPFEATSVVLRLLHSPSLMIALTSSLMALIIFSLHFHLF